MAVAPLPVMVLHFVILMFVDNIGAVPTLEIFPVSAVLVIVPVVVVVMVPIVDADLHVGFLRQWSSHDYGWCSNGGSQDDGADKTIQIAQDVFLQVRELQMENPGREECAPPGWRCMSHFVLVIKL
jgi:hypothetical protein